MPPNYFCSESFSFNESKTFTGTVNRTLGSSDNEICLSTIATAKTSGPGSSLLR